MQDAVSEWIVGLAGPGSCERLGHLRARRACWRDQDGVRSREHASCEAAVEERPIPPHPMTVQVLRNRQSIDCVGGSQPGDTIAPH